MQDMIIYCVGALSFCLIIDFDLITGAHIKNEKLKGKIQGS